MILESLFAQLFLKMQQRIETEVPEIPWVDQDLGQLDFYEIKPPVILPCALIDFNSTSYDQMQGGQQWGNAAFGVRLGFPAFSSANSAAPQRAKEKALVYYELEHKLYKALQAWDADGLIQPATRISAITERRDDALRVRFLVFNTTFMDDSAATEYDQVETPDLEMLFNPPAE